MKVSIIIPAYNVETYLAEAVESALNQTYKDVEIIIINDGSTDSTGEICDNFQRNYSNIIVIHQSNKGPSAARNTGMDKASGEYFYFLDGDDYISVATIETLVDVMNKEPINVVVSGIKKWDSVLPEDKDPINIVSECISGKEAFCDLLAQKFITSSANGILIKNDLAKRFPFPEGKTHEDDLTTYKYYINTEKVVLVKHDLYFYRQRVGSIMHSPFSDSQIDALDAGDNFILVCEDSFPELKGYAISRAFSNYCQLFLRYPDLKIHNSLVYERILSFFRKYSWKVAFCNDSIRIKNRVAALSIIGNIRFLYWLNSIGNRR